MLKTTYTLLICLLIVNACKTLEPSHSIANYFIEESYPYPWVDISSGIWAIYDVDAPLNVAIDITDVAYQDFKELLGSRLLPQTQLSNLLIDRTVDVSVLTNIQLSEIAEISTMDYIVLIKAKEGKENHYTEHNHAYNRADEDSRTYTKIEYQESYANIKIYDLQKKELIFDRSCKAVLKTKDKQVIHFSPSQQKVLKKAYKKLFRSLKAQVKT